VAPAPAAPRTIEIVTIPAGAEVALDGREQPGRTPLVVAVPGAPVELRLARAGYATARRTLPGPAGGRDRLVVALEPAPGTLEVRGTPAGARVSLDGRPLGPLPAAARGVDTTRPHLLTVTAAGHAPLQQVLEPGRDWLPVADGRVLGVSVALARRAAVLPRVPRARSVLAATPSRRPEPERAAAPEVSGIKRPRWAAP
jgi:hypothetical protein